jgi:predicted NACHT family NTPase
LSYGNLKNFTQWWQENSQVWTEQLRAMMIEHRNIGHDWQISNAQKKLLQHYYDANKLLVDCLNSDCYVSRDVRQEIEETLLLPIEEIKKRRSRRDDGVIGECNKNDEKT